MKGLILLILTIAGGFSAVAQTDYSESYNEPDFRLPDEVKEFVEDRRQAVAYAKGDLNADGISDYVLVTEKAEKWPDEAPDERSRRQTLIIVRGRDGKLSVAAGNDRVVGCGECGGGMGDPFEIIVTNRGFLSITNQGGTRERWMRRYEFRYSGRDRTWQLERVYEASRDSTDLNSIREKNYVTPKDFGKIDFADFDPENYKGKRTRKVSAYVYAYDYEEFPIVPVLVKVARRVDARAPLAGAVKALLAGARPEEARRGEKSFISGLEFVSANLENGTARIDLKFGPKGRNGLDLDLMELLFDQAIEQTARQFSNVKRVQVRVDGVENFLLFPQKIKR